MAVGTLDRPVRTEEPQAPAPRRTSALRDRLRRRSADRGPAPALAAELERVRRLEGTTALLERARALVAQCWVQDSFYVVRGRNGETRPVSPFGLLLLSRHDVVGACLVGAVAHASSVTDRQDRRGQAALAVDTLWQTLTGGGDVSDVHPGARAARVRELARWNDEQTRCQADVLDLLDRAVSRTILQSVR
ncbi:MAG TPA: hypothetical protein VLM05_17720 [Mycobacteriales bacterium]|nr:hypothetical protein [Mycobacteriales bacterium]